MIDSVVDLFEEHVDLGGSQFSESIVERWYLTRISQRNVVVLESGSPCSPRSPSSVHDSRHEQQWIFHSFTKYFIINVERIAFMSRTYSRTVLCFSCMNSSNKSPRSVMSLLNIETLTVFRWTCLIYLCFNKSSRSVWRTEFFVKWINIDLLRTGRVSSILHVIRSPRSVTNWIWSWLVGKILLVEQLLLLVVVQLPLLIVEQLFNPILLSIRASVRSLAEVEVTCILFRIGLLQSSISQLLDYNKLEVFLEGWLHSIVSDRISILSESQDWCRPNTLCFDVCSILSACTKQDAVHSGQSFRKGKPRLCGANGRLVLSRKRMVACMLTCFVPLFAVIVRRRALCQEESSFVSFAVLMATVLLHKVHVKPYLVMATLVGLSDSQSVVGMGNAPCCRTFQRLSESGGLRNPHMSDPRTRHRPQTPQRCGARRHR